MRYGLALLFLLSSPLLFASPTPAPPDEKEVWNRPVPEWWEGPVWYALTDGEKGEYRALTSPAERATFIARFWAARDPDPLTLDNEMESTFWKRVSAADELFTHTTISGWRTDQGRVYIVLGPPDERTSYTVPAVEQLDPTHFPDPYRKWSPTEIRPGQWGAEEWIYRSLKDSRADAGQTVTFIRDGSGEFHLSGQIASSFRLEPNPLGPATNQTIYTSNKVQGPKSGGGNAFTRAAGQSNQSKTGPTRDDPAAYKPVINEAAVNFQARINSVENLFAFGKAGLLQKIDAPAGGQGRVSTTESFGKIPLLSRIGLFQGEGGTNAMIVLGVLSDELNSEANPGQEIEIFGRLESTGSSSSAYAISTAHPIAEETPLQEIGGRNYRLYLIRGKLVPGEYRVSLGVHVGDRAGSFQDRIQVPDFGGEKLEIAGPILAERTGDRDSSEETPGFALGGLRMLPKLAPVFEPEEEFGFGFQVYHARPDEADGRLHLDITYTVAARRNGLFSPLGKPVLLSDNPSPSHAYVFPLKGWSIGEYLLTVTASDRVSGSVETASAIFLVR